MSMYPVCIFMFFYTMWLVGFTVSVAQDLFYVITVAL